MDKVVFLGHYESGQTTLIKRLVEKKFIAVLGKTEPISNHIFIEEETQKPLFSIFDIDTYHTSPEYIQKNTESAKVVVITYSITNVETFEAVSNSIENIKDSGECTKKYYLLALQTDLDNERKICTEDGQKKAKEINAFFLEVSSKNGSNIELFADILKSDIITRKKELVSNKNPENQSKCCLLL